MAESVPVCCPECRREHTYTPPVYQCDCGAPVVLPLRPDVPPTQVHHRTWDDSWVEVGCSACGTSVQWPQPELGCGCGTLLRLPVAPYAEHGGAGAPGPTAPEAQDASRVPPASTSGTAGRTSEATATGALEECAGKRPSRTRPSFQPVTIRTAQDARTAAAQYLRWLGFDAVRVTEKRAASGVDLRGGGIVAHVDPSTDPTGFGDVETLWLNGLNEEAGTACFSLAGYTREARMRADSLGVALFVLDLTGMPQAVNDPADDLIRSVC
ncbi:hypothetical protein H181DRAFT_03861 [Streptomyces sp. WMMB 714]|uniref:hypothetical protein n=1 Tax=Streptomyces sp. WMMB 714 TaxID=1286822 RepID=UPI0005F7ABBD|nr:hypothetical protein [Streptomyces sp. WMMB 714]SCK43902.1 hypothetical protein H181DRAFT_03861 [Streptomyces sp. WMMB 714]